jgi:hypothetical protein
MPMISPREWRECFRSLLLESILKPYGTINFVVIANIITRHTGVVAYGKEYYWGGDLQVGIPVTSS